MRIKLIISLALVVVLAAVGLGLTGCSTGGASAQDIQPVNVSINNQQGIWVNGQGTVTVIPDVAVVNLGVQAQAATVSEALAQASPAMDRVVAALKDNGVAQKDIRTQFFNIQQTTRYDPNTQQSVVTGYMVSNIVTAKIRDVGKTGAIIDAVAAAGGDLTRVNGVSFTVDNPEQYYAQARQAAVADARAKADQLASLAGVTLGRATFISESTGSAPIPFPAPTLGADSGRPIPTTIITPGETDIILNVQVAYAIQ